jgi:hypothetical protein
MRMKIAMRIAARISRADGTLTEENYQKVMSVIRHPNQVKEDGTRIDLLHEIENHVNSEMGYQGLGINWDSVIAWFKAHWLDILKLIVAILPLFFLQTPPETDLDDKGNKDES